MRTLILIALLCTTAVAHAVDYRWTRGHAMGTTEAIIRNEDGSSLNIYCPSGQLDTTPGMFVHVSRIRPKVKEQIQIQIIIDGNSHAFYLAESQFEAGGRANESAFLDLVSALRDSKEKEFTIEFPYFKISERFSLLDIKKAMGEGKNSILAGC